MHKLALVFCFTLPLLACSSPGNGYLLPFEGDAKQDSVTGDVADHSCQVVLNEASFTALGRSQCTLRGTVDVSRSLANLNLVQVLYRVEGQDQWSAQAVDTEIADAPAGLRRFAFHTQFLCNPVEFIPFASIGDHKLWDHNRTDGNLRLAGGSPPITPGACAASASDVADTSCQVVLNEASFTALGRSQCTLRGTVDVSRSLANLNLVQVLYRVKGQDQWSEQPADSEVAGAPTGFRRFGFDVQFLCNPIEFIPFASIGDHKIWDHNRTAGNYQSGDGDATPITSICHG